MTNCCIGLKFNTAREVVWAFVTLAGFGAGLSYGHVYGITLKGAVALNWSGGPRKGNAEQYVLAAVSSVNPGICRIRLIRTSVVRSAGLLPFG
jgi:hypothetical protein